ncbi:hypothetical protein GUITHDRAFT_116781 [Guillardia theta CCMP2712]|uniref:Uncharacterized protein n=1 Tax=Guillardia theta (strain CCMP2712) TaxID=905079 RepID=L1IML7_GUITC|nr:hypothetical protein GUITHDRAFT_116781 [Guillardia theta CCMP2712]EKX37055.1 hypothetical protein GUITHDRAFT_116781 [Guillardia theta CCMP2712]|eukprot:XP_005824035.1 hypothetical protein GUITHDRAFT_116781 [Guillardia theta CCMP2712]
MKAQYAEKMSGLEKEAEELREAKRGLEDRLQELEKGSAGGGSQDGSTAGSDSPAAVVDGERISQLGMMLEREKEDKMRAVQKLQELNMARMKLQEEHEKLKEQLEELKVKSSEADPTVAKGSSSQNEKTSGKHRLQMEKDAADSASRIEIEQVKEKSKDFLKKAVDSKKVLENKIKEMKDKQLASDALVTELQNTIQGLQIRLGILNPSGDPLLRPLDEELSPDVGRAETARAKFQSSLQGGGEKDGALEGVEERSSELVRLTARLDARTNELDRMKSDMEVMRKGNEELQRENKRLSDQIQNQQELHSAEVQELQRQVEVLRTAKSHAESAMRKSMEGEIFDLRDKVSNLQDALNKAQHVEHMLREEERLLRKQIESLHLQLNEFDYRRGDAAMDSNDYRFSNRFGAQEGMQVIVAQAEGPALEREEEDRARASKQEDGEGEVRRTEVSDPKEGQAVQTPGSLIMEESIFTLKSPATKRASSSDSGKENLGEAAGDGKDQEVTSVFSGHVEKWDNEADKLRSILSESGEDTNNAVPDLKSAVQQAVQQALAEAEERMEDERRQEKNVAALTL